MLRIAVAGTRVKGGKRVTAGYLGITAVPYTKTEQWDLLIDVGGAEFRQMISPSTRDKLQAFLEALENDQK